ncbi:MAG: hypothetical protein ACRC8A_19600 [Microcoleaceae cyanobacterium]
MNSDGNPASTPSDLNHKLAGVLGAFIALLTLTLPLLAVTQYSPSQLTRSEAGTSGVFLWRSK